MLLRTIIFSALALSPVAGSLLAHKPQTSNRLPPLQTLARFEVVFGKLTAGGSYSRQSKTISVSDPQGQRQESFAIAFQGCGCTVSYRSNCPRQQFSVDFHGDGQVEIVRQGREKSGSTLLHFRQAANGRTQLVLGEGEERKQYQADSLWHLLMAEPEVCNRHLVPILHRLRRGWNLADQAHDVEQTLLKLAENNTRPRQDWDRLIDQIDSDSFQERQAADRKLRRSGIAVLFHLQQLDTDKLSAEQRLRISKIIKSLTASRSDTPQMVAAWLVDDPSVWLAMLSHQSLSRRKTAAEQLTRIQRRPIDFDPTANVTLRQAQIKRLRR